jgi:hypothetical protein
MIQWEDEKLNDNSPVGLVTIAVDARHIDTLRFSSILHQFSILESIIWACAYVRRWTMLFNLVIYIHPIQIIFMITSRWHISQLHVILIEKILFDCTDNRNRSIQYFLLLVFYPWYIAIDNRWVVHLYLLWNNILPVYFKNKRICQLTRNCFSSIHLNIERILYTFWL